MWSFDLDFLILGGLAHEDSTQVLGAGNGVGEKSPCAHVLRGDYSRFHCWKDSCLAVTGAAVSVSGYTDLSGLHNSLIQTRETAA